MQIQILDEIWCVFFVPPYSKYLSGHLGVCDDLNNVIFVADNLDEEKMQEVTGGIKDLVLSIDKNF